VTTTNKYGVEKPKPDEIVDYNNFMSGIDRSDQISVTTRVPEKQLDGTKKVLFHLLDFTIWNSYFVYKKHFDVNVSYKQFRDLFIKNFIGLPIQTTASELFKNKKKPKDAPENNHYAEKIPLPQNYKRQTYF